MKNKIMRVHLTITVALILLPLIHFGCDPQISFVLSTAQSISTLTIEAGDSASIIFVGEVHGDPSDNPTFFSVSMGATNLPDLSGNGCGSVPFEGFGGSCTMTFNVPSNTMSGDYYVILNGAAGFDGYTDFREDDLELIITVPEPDFSIAFETESITIEQGQSETVAINISRDYNNTEGIDFVIETFDPLLNGTISPANNVTGNTINYILNVDLIISPGNHSVIVTGTGVATSVSRSDTLEITVTVAPTTMWVEETPAGFETTVFNDVYFINENAGVTVGGNGVILGTGDGGDNWTNEPVATNSQLRGVHSDGSDWYAVGENLSNNNGEIIRSLTGSWERVTDAIPTALNDVFVIDANNIWSVGDDGGAYYTTDRGATWISKTITIGDLKQIWFTTPSEGFIGSSNPNKIFKTTDGGDNWTEVHSISSGGLLNMFFSDSQTGFVAYSTGVDVTTTGGGNGSWSSLSNLPASVGINAISFLGSQFGLLVGGSAQNLFVYRTEDGGMSWENDNMAGLNGFQFFNAVAVLSQTSAVAVGQWGIARRYVE